MTTVMPEIRSMFTRDGVRLDADVYRPAGKGPFPVLLMRQPYGRRIASTVTYAHPAWYASQGYLVVIQDVRGRGCSEGGFEPFVNERNDGEDTLEWVANLPDSNGRVGMYGFSYQGATQLFAAASRHPALEVIAPAMCAFWLDRDWAYEGGALRLYNTLSWAAQLGAESARRRGDDEGYTACYGIGHGPSAEQLIDPAASKLRKSLADTFYSDWLDQPVGSEYWQERSPGALLDGVDIPALHVGGWYDAFFTGTLAAYKHFRGAARQPQHLLIGPWGHLPWTPQVGQRWFGDSARSPVDAVQLRWFNHFLKDEDNGITAEKPVSLYDLGECRWRRFSDWPTPEPSRRYLSSNGLAGSDPDAGKLSPEPAAAAPRDVWVHDPWRPVPVTGGHLPPSTGIQERSSVDARPDVLTYTTQPLSRTLTLAGEVRAILHGSADVASFDLCAVLSTVDQQDRSHNLTQGYVRVNGEGVVSVSLRGVCATIAAGQRLRLSISAACYPAYALNDGSARVPGATRASDYPIMTLQLDTSESWLELPVVCATDNG